ncbi:MAG TPA: lysylphosphatidylglycerol synthase transmembrane domain-containing protein [Gemmatimonadales bacterium]|nr:lysylphosphatidylglycerol synthase transmembrane domain-containing protein [Gemmatimonadales bacterium]
MTTTEPTAAPQRGRHAAAALVGVAVSVLLLWWSMRNVDLAEVGGHLRSARLTPLLAGVAIATLTFVIRAIRWNYFLRSDADEEVPWGPRWHSVAIGFMANNLLPFRAGEIIRALAISRLGRVRMAAAITSLVVERVLDALALVSLFVLGLFLSGLPPATTVLGVSVARAATVAAALGTVAIGAGLVMVIWPHWTEVVLRRLLPEGRLRARLISIGHGITSGLSVLRSPARIALVAAWSLVLWLVNGLSFFVMFKAFDIDVGVTGALILQGALALGVSVPSTPGYVGPFEAAIVAVLELYAVPSSKAFSYAMAYHASTFLPIVLLGFWSLLRTPLAFRDLRRTTAAVAE